MKRIAFLALVTALLAAGVIAYGQSDLEAFPIGTTKMVYSVTVEDLSEPQILELIVTAHEDGRYTVRMVTEQTGDEDELATGFGFIFGAATVSSGGGHDVSYSSLQALMDQRSRLQEGAEYQLPSGVFTDIVGVTIAGVWCLEGTLLDEDDPAVRMTVAFALTNPVYISPRIRAEELRAGEWVETFALELIEYTVTEGGG
ncbi:MAG: hypothetical protein WBC63_06610 [Candidatus Bipolaricaulia bacterium]